MNDKQLEAAARKLCEHYGIDPDEQVSIGVEWDGNTHKRLSRSRWQYTSKTIVDHLALMESIEHGLKQE